MRDTVKRGQILALLESPDLSDALKREQSSYQQLEAEVARQQILARKQKLLAQREADTAEIDRLSAQRTLERYQAVANEGVIAKIDFQKAKDALASAEIRAKHAAKAAALEGDDVGLALKTKVNELDRQRLSMANAQRRVDELSVRAPVDGFIGTLSVQNRSVVAANTALMTLVDLSRLEVELEVPESYVADMGLGMSAEIQLGTATAGGQAVGPVAGSGAQPGAGARALRRRAAQGPAPEPARDRAPADRRKAERHPGAARSLRRIRGRPLRLRRARLDRGAHPDHAGRDQRRQCRNYVRRAAGRQACDFRYRHVRQCGARLHQ
ncbi:efflux RND transporter periplasmic adaptor subunit [Massilia sp. H-1]|nr:efflux RND transporter periplasmic adaptor subunit [Massilia sp. H-1]